MREPQYHGQTTCREESQGNINLLGSPYWFGMVRLSMELRHLRYFVAVAEEENVTRAAMRLRVSQPPLSRQIRDLEDELGVPLFEHTAKAVRLTHAGRIFLTEAKAVLRRTDEAIQTLKAAGNGDRGDVHVGYAPSLTVEFLPRALRSFEKRHREVKVHLHDLSTQEMLKGLRERHLDVALVVQPSTKSLTGLQFEELCRQAVCVALHPKHRLARASKVGAEQLVTERLIAFTREDYPEHHHWLRDLFAPFKRMPQIVEEHDSSNSLIASVEAGKGVALVLEGFDCLAGPRLKVKRLVPPPPPFVVGVAHVAKVSSAATNFISSVRSAIRGGRHSVK